ncbi:MAG: hypothetical protein KZQ99_00920 [Candidatus Thiodiazotropha sp. (ex Dulcina madagascariensis)]|nr:hypothetical protein [Candidatus Thiodiazotropha sp. (ex Dulcina madagascariensis)]
METILFIIGSAAIILLGVFALFAGLYKKVAQGKAMIVSTLSRDPKVTFTGALVLPVIHLKEMMTISLKTIEIDRRGHDGLICKDNIRADIKVTFFVRVNMTKDDVLKVAQAVGVERASDQASVEELFSAKFSEALKTVGKRMDFISLYEERDAFRDDIIEVIGKDLNGYVLEDAAIDYLEQTPIESLDRDNILDAEGIRKITELTATQHISTNEFERDEEKAIKKKDVETREAVLQLEKQEKDAIARQQREVATIQAREEAETQKIQAEERLRAEEARIKMEEAIAIQEENKQREIEVAAYQRQSVTVKEAEGVTKAKDLEIVERERIVALADYAKDKEIEQEKKEIADLTSDRISVEKRVAEEEENIEKVRLVSKAEREKEATIIAAEAEAQEGLVKEVKAAEAEAQKAIQKAQEEVTLAEGHKKSATLDAEAAIKQAEATRSREAAPGLAKAEVMEATAVAKEKDGLAEAVILREKLEAQAIGDEKVGLAAARIKEADAEAVEKMGEADAKNVELRFLAEANGLKEKFTAMDAMSDDSRQHEEFRLKLDLNHTETMRWIEANTEIAKEQADILASALSDANIDIVGGSGDYFEKFVNALAVGKSIDGVVRGETAQKLLGKHLSGEADLIEDIKDIATGLGGNSDSLQNLTVSAFIAKLMREGNPEQKDMLQKLMGSVSGQKTSEST